jgi:hypothetical protein
MTLERTSAGLDGIALSTAADTITNEARAPSTKVTDDWSLSTWAAWASELDLPHLPAAERDLCRFLMAHRHRWGAKTMECVIGGIRWHHRLRALPDPCGALLQRTMSAVARIGGVSTADPTPALMPELAAEVLHTLAQPQRSPLPLAAIALVRNGLDLDQLRHIGPTDVTKTRIGWRIGNRRHGATLRNADPIEAAAANALHQRIASETKPFGSNTLTAVRATFSRAGLKGGSTTAEVTAAIRALDADGYACLVRWCDLTLARRLRNRALIAVGVANARRAIELSRLDRGDIEPIPVGWALVYRQHKTRLDGSAPIERTVGHIGPEAGPCRDDRCPACALGDWLELLDQRWPGRAATAPAFPSKLGHIDAVGRFTTSGIRQLIITNCGQMPGAPAGLTSRSMRVGGATAAYDAGMSVVAIAIEVTGHADLEHLARYVRLQRPEHGTYKLPL